MMSFSITHVRIQVKFSPFHSSYTACSCPETLVLFVILGITFPDHGRTIVFLSFGILYIDLYPKRLHWVIILQKNLYCVVYWTWPSSESRVRSVSTMPISSG